MQGAGTTKFVCATFWSGQGYLDFLVLLTSLEAGVLVAWLDRSCC